MFREVVSDPTTFPQFVAYNTFELLHEWDSHHSYLYDKVDQMFLT